MAISTDQGRHSTDATHARRFRCDDDMASFRLDSSAAHLAIDMQRLFAEPTEWHVPWMPRILPNVVEIATRAPQRTLCTRFIPPETPEQAPGAWRDYYRQWQGMTRDTLDPGLLELVEPLGRICPPARTIDKSAYSAFSNPRLAAALRRRHIQTLIVTGGETDVCVLATVMSAVDLGFEIVLPADALCSARDETHDALMTLYRERFTHQVRTVSTEEVIREWKPAAA